MEAIRILSTDALEPAAQDPYEGLAPRARADADALAKVYIQHRDSVFRYLRARSRDELDR